MHNSNDFTVLISHVDIYNTREQDCSLVYMVPARIFLAKEDSIRAAIQESDHEIAREFVRIEVLDYLLDAADDLRILDLRVDCQMDRDGNLIVALSFDHEADMALFKSHVS
jgi:hypothetical protein